MEDVLAAQRRYFDSGATRPLRFRREMLTRLRVDYGYYHTDALLVLEDILARVWKGQM